MAAEGRPPKHTPMEFHPAPLLLAIGLTLIFPVHSQAQASIKPFRQPQAQGPTQESSPTFSLGGMLAGAGLARFDSTFEPFFSLRFIPELTFSLPAGRGLTLDAEISANAYGAVNFLADAAADASTGLKPYRGWLRLSASRFEARVGLQKLSFGPAALFRPLMWFDSLDPRDPLQLTDGVYGLLLRYYTRGNANVWAWGLYGNDDRRGFDLAPPDKKAPEFGGRVELPLFKGEIGATYHRRKAAIDGLTPIMSPAPVSPLPVPPVPEDRIGFDGKWDLGVGVWFEGALVHQQTPLLPHPYQRAYTLGLDYTFALGRGLTALAEHFRIASSVRAFSPGDGLSFTALLLRYPLGILDEISGIFYYDWKNNDIYRFISWKHTTDALSFSAIVFWNPATPSVFQGQPGAGSFAGTGLELLLAYHF